MNFPQFLENVRTLKNICSLRDLYDFYGGENRLAMSLRHFQLICSGKSPPNERLLTTVFEKSPACDRSSLVLAYLKSTVGAKEGNEANLLLSFVEQNLLSGEEFEAKSLWETVPQHQTYTESQLDCLISDPVIFRFYMRLLLLNDCPIKECRLPDATIRKLQKLDLVQVTKNYIQPAMQFMKLPRYEDSSPRSVSKATDYILKLLEIFVSKEGSPLQELSFTFQMVSPEAAAKIRERTKALKRYVQSLGSRKMGEGVTPFLYVCLAKQLEPKDLN